MASSEKFVLKAFKTEADAKANTNYLNVDTLTAASGSTIDNPSQDTTYGFWAFQRYWYRIEANEPVSEFHIDWDDGEDNSDKKANVSIIKNDSPSFYGITSHIFTQSKPFYPLIRTKSIEGFLSKWYTSHARSNDIALNTFSGLDDDIKATAGNTTATTIITLYGAVSGTETITIISTDNTTKTYTATTDPTSVSPEFYGGNESGKDVALQLKDAIEHANGHGSKITITKTGLVLTLTQAVTGKYGNTAVTTSESFFTTGGSAPDFSGGSGFVTGEIHDSGQNRFSVVSIEKNDGSTAYARIPILKPANVPPIGVLKTDRKKAFAGMDNVWLGNNNRVLTGSGAIEMPYSHTVNAICSNPNRIDTQAKVTYQEGRIGGVSAVTEVTTTAYGSYIRSGSTHRSAFTAGDLDQKIIYITSMDETYACYFLFENEQDVISNSVAPTLVAPYANALRVPITINALDSTGGDQYVTAENLATALAGELNDQDSAPGIYHGRQEFSVVAANTTSSYETFQVVVTGSSFENSDTTEKAPAAAAASQDDGLTTASSDILNYGNYFTFSTPSTFDIVPTNYYMWFRQAAKVEKFIIGVGGDSFTGGGDEIEATYPTTNDGLTTHASLTEPYGNYFTFSTLNTASPAVEVDYYAWFKQAIVNEELTITIGGNSFTSDPTPVEKSANSSGPGVEVDDGLSTWFGTGPSSVGNYFQFNYDDTNYLVWFKQEGITELTLFEFAVAFDGTLNEASLEDAWTLVYDMEGDGWLAYFETGTDENAAPSQGQAYTKKIILAPGATRDDAAEELRDAYNEYQNWGLPGSSTSTPFTATLMPSTPRVQIECNAPGNTTDGSDGQTAQVPPMAGAGGYITTLTTRQGRDAGTTPRGWHAFESGGFSNADLSILYADGDNRTTIKTKLKTQLETHFSSITGLSVAYGSSLQVVITAVGALTFFPNLSDDTAFTSHDGLTDGGPSDIDLSTGFTFSSVEGKNEGLDPATSASHTSLLSGKTAIEIDYDDGDDKGDIVLTLLSNLASGIPVAERDGPSSSGYDVTIQLKIGGAVTHAADGVTAGGMDLSTGMEFVTGRIDGKNEGQDPVTPHYSRLNGMTACPPAGIGYADGATKTSITALMVAELERENLGTKIYPWSVTEINDTTFQVTMDQAGPTEDVTDGTTGGVIDLDTGFTFSVPGDATGRYKLTTTHVNKGLVRVAGFHPPMSGGESGTPGLITTAYDLFERIDSTATPPAYYGPRFTTEGVDASDGSIKQKTLTCVAPVLGEYQTGSRLNNVGKILKMELVNNLENADSYGGSTGTSTLAPGERIYLQTTLNTNSDNSLPGSTMRLDNRNLCGTVCSVSLGNPIVEENSIGSRLSVDVTESKVRCSNKSISYFFIDDNKLISGDTSEGATDTGSHQAGDTNNITDKLVGGADFKSTIGTKDLWYTFDWWREHQDANHRYYSYKRLVRAQIEDNHGTSTADDAFNLSPIVHWDSSTYLTIGSATALSDGQPSDISKWNYGVFLFTNQAKIRTPNWVDLNVNNREDRIPIFGSDANQTGGSFTSNTLGNSSDFDTLSTALHYAPDNRYDAKQAETMIGEFTIDDIGPRNALFMARKEKFDRIFVRVSHDRFNAAGQVISDLVSDITVGTTAGWPKMRMQVLYPAKKTRNSSTIIWKPLPVIDRTMLKGKEDSSFYKSGDIVFIPPVDWEKTSHSANIEYPYEDNFFDDGTASGTNGIDDKWNKDSYALIFLITHIDSAGDGTGAERVRNVFNVMSMYPYNNSHSQLIEIVDPTHVSLNKFGIAQSVSFVRKGKYQEIKDRSGISLMRRVGAEAGQIKLGGIDLSGDTELTRIKFHEFQKDSVPVYYDVTHKDDSKTRLFGVMTDMSEDHPTSGLIPKFACSLKVTHILEIDSSGNITGKGYKPLGGDAIDVEQYLSAS